MGGNAISGAVRLSNEEFNTFREQFYYDFKRDFGDKYYTGIAKSYFQKESHGDLDIIIGPWDAKPDPQHFVDYLTWRYSLSADKIVANIANDKQSAVISIPITMDDDKVFQVDIIYTASASQACFSESYFSYNDLGNLMGVVAHNLGFKFGHRGFRYKLYDTETEQIAEIEVTDNFEKAITFLGFDFNRWAQGFNTLEEIFEFVRSGPYVDSESYKVENRSSDARRRDTHRPTYQAFLNYLEGHAPKKFVPQEDFVERAKKEFPEFNESVERAIDLHRREKEKNRLFNGTVVSGLTGLKGKPLGLFIEHLVKTTSIKQAVMEQDEKRIKSIIIGTYSKLLVMTGGVV